MIFLSARPFLFFGICESKGGENLRLLVEEMDFCDLPTFMMLDLARKRTCQEILPLVSFLALWPS